jgi:cytidylate kinase
MIARELDYTYLDTGAMYRAVAWALLQAGPQGPSKEGLADRLRTLPLRFVIDNGSMVIFYGNQRLDEELRGPEISQETSRISQMEPVRNFLVEWQRQLGASGGIVAEGRDMTTVVFPDAEVKVFLTADLRTRTERRLAEYLEKGVSVSYPELEEEIRRRDERDSNRELAPLRPAPDAIQMDTSNLTVAEVADRILGFVGLKVKAREARSGI